jgi:hypothetical protein
MNEIYDLFRGFSFDFKIKLKAAVMLPRGHDHKILLRLSVIIFRLVQTQAC